MRLLRQKDALESWMPSCDLWGKRDAREVSMNQNKHRFLHLDAACMCMYIKLQSLKNKGIRQLMYFKVWVVHAHVP
jgi:hypothetical protein